MPLIVWSEELSLGIDSIDNQHKKLVEIINNLDESMKGNDSNIQLKAIFAELNQYTQRHFYYEEKLFEQHGYQDSIEHKRQHAELIVQLTELKEKCDHYQNESVTQDVMQFLKNWLTYHILKTDKAYSQFLIAKGVN